MRGSAIADEAEEAGLVARIRLEVAGKGRGERGRPLLLDAAHGHAHVFGLDHHRDAARLQRFISRGGNLRPPVLLRLAAAAAYIAHAGDLRPYEHPPALREEQPP